MRATDNSEPVAGDVVHVVRTENNQHENVSIQGDKNSKPVLLQPAEGVAQQSNLEIDSSKLCVVSGSEQTVQNMQQNVVFVPQNMPERVVYVSNHNPAGDPRVVNILQGREFYPASDISQGKTHIPNKIQESETHIQNTTSEQSEHVVCGQAKTPEDNVSAQSKTENTQVNNGSETRVVNVQHSVADGNDSEPNTIKGPNTLEPNNTEQRVLYTPHNIPTNNTPVSTMNMSASDPNQMPVCIVYVPPQMPDGNVNMQTGIPGVAIHAPNDMQNVQYTTSNMPPRTPSPNRTPSPSMQGKECAMKVAQQVMTVAGKMMKSNHGNNHNSDRIMYVTQPIVQQPVYSPYMMQQVPYQGEFIPQMQYSNVYASQQMLHQEMCMPHMYPTFVPPSPQPVQDSLYMASPPDSSSFMSQSSLIPQHSPEISPPMGSTSAFDNVTDYLDQDVDDGCCSWLDCCSCLFDCCSD